MEELITRLVSKTGISEDLAKSAIEIILGILAKDGPQDKVALVLDGLPGARELIGDTENKSGGLLGGLMGSMGAMGALNKMTSAGLDMGQVQNVSKEIIGFAREKAGDDVVDDVVRSIPGLSQFV